MPCKVQSLLPSIGLELYQLGVQTWAKKTGWVPPKLSRFVFAYHQSAPGSSPKHTIYAFSFIVQFYALPKGLNKKVAGFVPYLQNLPKTFQNFNFPKVTLLVTLASSLQNKFNLFTLIFVSKQCDNIGRFFAL